MDIASLFNAMPGAVSQGMMWGIMAIGVYITFRILDIADLTVDGHVPLLHGELGLAAGVHRRGELQQILQFDVFCCDGDRFHSNEPRSWIACVMEHGAPLQRRTTLSSRWERGNGFPRQ